MSTNPIREKRILAGLDLTRTAKICGVSVRTVSRWEAGRQAPSARALALIDKAVEVETLIQRRLDLDVTQDELARRMGVTQATLSRWETLERLPRSRMAWTHWRMVLGEIEAERAVRAAGSSGSTTSAPVRVPSSRSSDGRSSAASQDGEDSAC